MKLYTCVNQHGNFMKCIGRDMKTGERFAIKEKCKPTLFCDTTEPTEYKSMRGTPVKRMDFNSIFDARNYIKNFADVDDFTVYGNDRWMYQYISDRFPQDDYDYDMDKLNIAFIDIETTCENGFPKVDNPIEEVIVITMYLKGTYFVFGNGHYESERDDVKYMEFDNESDLLKAFVKFWESVEIDIVTGWNIDFFDLPYMIARMDYIMPDSWSKRLSPWGFRKFREVRLDQYGDSQTTVDIDGISNLDYLLLYKKLIPQKKESYKLDYIAHDELGIEKINYDEYDSIKTFYKSDWKKFVDYNIRDVELVVGLEEKLSLLAVSIDMTYTAKCNFKDVYFQVRMWESIIYNELKKENIACPLAHVRGDGPAGAYEGAYVKAPIIGLHEWVVSYDLASLYPHIVMQYNLGAETIVETNKFDDYGLNDFKVLKIDETIKDLSKLDYMKNTKDVCVAANSEYFRTDFKGIVPKIMEKMYIKRKETKRKMINHEKLAEETTGDEKQKHKDLAKKYKISQLSQKVCLNSGYGSIGNHYCRYYDVRVATAITLTGQMIVKYAEKVFNDFLNKHFGTDSYDYVVAMDTDSCYLRLKNVILSNNSSKPSNPVDRLDKFCKKHLDPLISKAFEELSKAMCCPENKMVMERETIADKAIWTAKKRYAMNVLDSEGVRYKEPDLKITGIEVQRSSTPEVVRDKLKESIRIMLQEDEETLHKFVEQTKQTFDKCRVEDIAFPRGVTDIVKWQRQDGYAKGTPIGSKTAILYNKLLEEKNLSRYERINEGDKVKFVYLREPNPINEKAIAFVSVLPKEFDLHPFIDYEMMFEKTYLKPLTTLLDAIGWSSEPVPSLEGLFV